MDRYRLKNVIIIILLLVNCFLLGSLAIQQSSEYTARVQTEEQLVALFAADGMTLERTAISKSVPPVSLSLTRDTAHDRAVAAFFLGDALSQGNQGDTYTYTGNSGVAIFRSNGNFDIAGTLSTKNTQDSCREFCKTFGYDEPVFLLAENGDGTATASARYNKLSVFNGTVTFSFSGGTLVTVSGTLLPESSSAAESNQEPLSAVAALTALQKMRRETGAVVSAITAMHPCYELQSSTAARISLVPAWCIVTNTSKYYVNCLTGIVTSG